MRMERKGSIKKYIIELCCVFLGCILAAYSQSKEVWIFVVLMIGLLIVDALFSKKVDKAIFIVGIIFFVASGIYFVGKMLPYVWQNDSSEKWQLSQLSIPKMSDGNDMWISPVIDGKIVNLTYATPWVWDYFEEFSEETVVEEREVVNLIDYLWQYVEPDEFVMLEGMSYLGTRDLFDEAELEQINSAGIRPRLYLDINYLDDTEEVYVVTDENYNIYLISTELLQRILGDLAKKA